MLISILTSQTINKNSHLNCTSKHVQYENELISKNLIMSPLNINGKTKENITRSSTTVPDPVHVPDPVICPD